MTVTYTKHLKGVDRVMTMTDIRIVRDWDRRREGLLKHPKAKRSRLERNDKRRERYEGTFEDRRAVKYSVSYDCCFDFETGDSEDLSPVS